MKFFDSYRRLSQRDRALLDGRLITYHFYVGGLTLVLLALHDAAHGAAHGVGHHMLEILVPGVALAFGLFSLAVGVALHVLHRRMIGSPQQDSYLAVITVVLGRHRFPVLPSVLGAVVVLSLLAMALRLVVS
ncbi:MAG: hypothetical protein IH608_00600 [Proteobacteria bacterium]|nr:hypothetical protein [Pseudomonadota bacterium]